MKNLALIIVLTFSLNSYSQSFINKYKYVVVDSKFDFIRTPDQYRSSSLVKFLFNKIGFKAFIETDEIPEELSKEPCQALFVTVRKLQNMLTIKTVIDLKDCLGKILHTSDVGKSKKKEFERGYYQSISRAFNSIEKLNYKYDKNFISKKQLESNVLIEKKDLSVKKIKAVEKSKVNTIPKSSSYTLLYAQENKGGFQLVNAKPEVIFIILQTTKENVFIIKDKNGVLLKKEEFWSAEYYDKGKIVVEKYQIKF